MIGLEEFTQPRTETKTSNAVMERRSQMKFRNQLWRAAWQLNRPALVALLAKSEGILTAHELAMYSALAAILLPDVSAAHLTLQVRHQDKVCTTMRYASQAIALENRRLAFVEAEVLFQMACLEQRPYAVAYWGQERTLRAETVKVSSGRFGQPNRQPWYTRPK